MDQHLLLLVTLAPTIFAILLLPIPKQWKRVHRVVTLVGSITIVAVSTRLWTGFNPDNPGFQFVDIFPWIPQFGISLHVGLDGISLFLVLLTTLLLPIVVLAAWSFDIEHIKGLHISFLVLTTGLIGTFVSLDLFFFYVFWEITLIPMYFIIGVWGGPRRIYAAVKFFIFTMVGSVFMLVAILYLAWFNHKLTGVWSYDYLDFLQTDIFTATENQQSLDKILQLPDISGPGIITQPVLCGDGKPPVGQVFLTDKIIHIVGQ